VGEEVAEGIVEEKVIERVRSLAQACDSTCLAFEARMKLSEVIKDHALM
jgi:hypothetical protein